MGIGDELMMAGEAKRRAAGTEKRFVMLDKHGMERWLDIWEGMPHVAKPGKKHDGSVGYLNGRRPYIVDETKEQRTFREYQPVPATIPLSEVARRHGRMGAGKIVFAPSIKAKAPINKAWGEANWRSLVLSSPDLNWLQLSPPGQSIFFQAAPSVEPPRFQYACGILAAARAVVCQEGALHHAAAALGVPCIVIRGGYISPKVTGYDGQVDLYIEDERYPVGCGMRVFCPHCKDAMALITPERVLTELRALLARTGR